MQLRIGTFSYDSHRHARHARLEGDFSVRLQGRACRRFHQGDHLLVDGEQVYQRDNRPAESRAYFRVHSVLLDAGRKVSGRGPAVLLGSGPLHTFEVAQGDVRKQALYVPVLSDELESFLRQYHHFSSAHYIGKGNASILEVCNNISHLKSDNDDAERVRELLETIARFYPKGRRCLVAEKIPPVPEFRIL